MENLELNLNEMYTDDEIYDLLEESEWSIISTEIRLLEFCESEGIDYENQQLLEESYFYIMDNQEYLEEGIIGDLWEGLKTLVKKILQALIYLFKNAIAFVRAVFNKIRQFFTGVSNPDAEFHNNKVSFISLESAQVKEINVNNYNQMKAAIIKSCASISKEIEHLSQKQTQITKQTESYIIKKGRDNMNEMADMSLLKNIYEGFDQIINPLNEVLSVTAIGGAAIVGVIASTIVTCVKRYMRLNTQAQLFVTDSKNNATIFKHSNLSKRDKCSSICHMDELDDVIRRYCLNKANYTTDKNGVNYVEVENPNKEYYVYAITADENNQMIYKFTLKDLERDSKYKIKVVQKSTRNELIKEGQEQIYASGVQQIVQKIYQYSGRKYFFSEGKIDKYTRYMSIKNGTQVSDLVKCEDTVKELKDYVSKMAIKKIKNGLKTTLLVEDINQDIHLYVITDDEVNRQINTIKIKDVSKYCPDLRIDSYKTYKELGLIQESDDINKSTNIQLTKSYSDTHLYSIVADNYNKQLMTFIRTAHEIDKTSESFKDIEYDVKRRQTSAAILKILQSENVVLMISQNNLPLPRTFKVITATDIRPGENKKKKVFIDATMLISNNDGVYKCNPVSVDILVAYLVDAASQFIYYADPKRIIMDRNMISEGAWCFSKLFTYVIDYLVKVSVNGNMRDQIMYISAVYYLKTILNKDLSDSHFKICKDISGLSDREIELLSLKFDMENYTNIKTFVHGIADLCINDKVTLDVIVNKWIYLYGQGTQFALELFPAFSNMITNTYNGQFLNNQPAIEKQCGTHMVNFSKGILNIIEAATK